MTQATLKPHLAVTSAVLKKAVLKDQEVEADDGEEKGEKDELEKDRLVSHTFLKSTWTCPAHSLFTIVHIGLWCHIFS